jgi:peptidyl-prolyl cis-trans isomerase B (cyclophilin B)
MIILNTSMGDITIELHKETAPNTVENFLSYVKSNYYKNTTFHRVINNFMIQGGGFDQHFNQDETMPTIKNEANIAKKNTTGTIAMARTAEPHSATCQFFINMADNAFLDFQSETLNGWGYCVFGEVIDGMEVVNNISKVATGFKNGHNDVPDSPVIINNIAIK